MSFIEDNSLLNPQNFYPWPKLIKIVSYFLRFINKLKLEKQVELNIYLFWN